MCRNVSDNERLEHRLEDLEKNVDVNQAVQDFADKKIQEQLDLLESKIAELEEKLEKAEVEDDSASKPQQKRLVEF